MRPAWGSWGWVSGLGLLCDLGPLPELQPSGFPSVKGLDLSSNRTYCDKGSIPYCTVQHGDHWPHESTEHLTEDLNV